MNDLVLTGVPRGGTTLACKLLGECQDTVALAEPIDVESLPADPLAATQGIRDFFAIARRELLATGRAPGKLVGGEVASNFFGGNDGPGRRQSVARHGQLQVNPPPAPGFTLAVKHNACFTALLPSLVDAIPAIALIRHPLPVLASWQTVELPVAHGRLPAGERFDPGLRKQIAHTPDLLDRQMLILDWFFSRFASPLAGLTVLKYEDIVASGGQCLFEAAGISAAPRALEDQNAKLLYRSVEPARLAAALAGFGGAWSGFYSAEDDAAALQRLGGPG